MNAVQQPPRASTVQVLDVLRNGATVIAVERTPRATYVLATEGKQIFGGIEFVSWRIDDEGYCDAGDYVIGLDVAADAFLERVQS